jgi:hypothetical protein
MSNFYSAGGPGGSSNTNGGGGFYDEGGYNGQQFQNQQQQQQQFQQPGYNNDMSQWQQPQPQQQQPQNNMHQQQQQQQQPQGTPFFAAPQGGGGGGLNVGGIASQAAARYMTGQGISQDDMKQVWESGFSRIIPGFDSTMQTLRSYYAVDNNYVKRKMQKVLFPFVSQSWRRTVSLANCVSASALVAPAHTIEYQS